MHSQPEDPSEFFSINPQPGAADDPLDDLIGPPPAAEVPKDRSGMVDFAPPGDFLEAYGLRENPFADSVHPTFFFRTDAHSEAFRSMLLAADFKTSLGLLTGPSGSGKTLVSQLLLQHLDERKFSFVLVLVTPGLSKTGLLREILAELGIALPVGVSRVQDLMKQLGNHIIEEHERGRRLVVLLDECHLLSSDCLHVVRTISNIETPEQKLVTCLLFGESRFLKRLKHPGYDSLRNRIYFRSELPPLNEFDSAQYVKYRLMAAGRLTDLFTDGALAALHRHSGGIARALNKLAMHCLIEGAMRHCGTIDEKVVDQAAKRL